MNNEERLEIVKKVLTKEYKKDLLRGLLFNTKTTAVHYKELTGRRSTQTNVYVLKNLYTEDIRINTPSNERINGYVNAEFFTVCDYIEDAEAFVFCYYNVTLETPAKFINAVVLNPDKTISCINKRKLKNTNRNTCYTIEARSEQRRRGCGYSYQRFPYDITFDNVVNFLQNRKHIPHTEAKDINKELEPYLSDLVIGDKFECSNGICAVISPVKDNIVCLRTFVKEWDNEQIEYVRIYFDKENKYFYVKDDCQEFTDNIESISFSGKSLKVLAESNILKKNVPIFLENNNVLNGTRFEYFSKDIQIASNLVKSDLGLFYVLMTDSLAETLYKQGFKNIASEYAHNKNIFGQLNDSNDFYKKIGVNKSQWTLIANLMEFSDPSGDIIFALKDILGTTSIDSISDDQIKKFLSLRLNNVSLRILKLLRETYSFKTMLQMLDKLRIMDDYAQGRTYEDYLQMVKELNMQDTFKANFKTNEELKNMHDAVVAIYNTKKYERQSKAFMEQIKKCKKYAYKNKNFEVVIPEKAEDLAREGMELHHCVKSYIGRVVNGDTNIVFIRKKEELDKPFFTVEITNDDTIQQVHGFANRNANTEKGIPEFVEEWAKKRNLNTSNYNKVR